MRIKSEIVSSELKKRISVIERKKKCNNIKKETK